MRFDGTNCLVSQIWPDSGSGWAGNRGDSLANSCRYALLDDSYSKYNLDQFCTRTGYVRHPDPNMPDDWKENDIPTDQALPYYLAASKDRKDQMKHRIKCAGWRTGNGDLVSPIFFAVLTNSQWKIDLCLLAQMALFKVPFRWNDEKKWFESMVGATADYLNFFHCLPWASVWVRKLVNKDTVKAKIHSYFESEPNVDWYLDLYDRAIERILR